MSHHSLELTDTFGGESNYSWVRRGGITINPPHKDTTRALVRQAKAWAGWTNHPCDVDDMGETIAIRPRYICQVLFVTFDPDQTSPQ